ncbi:uncharacterized protein [Musca autumnalis]|uniref:uncharacterized protein n=1 Tax=Musca autumnalis TaxID=221902 RepID=UPI003CF451DB
MDQLKAHLKQMGVDFPETATAQQLRRLLAEVIGASSLQQARADLPAEQQQEAVVPTNEQAQAEMPQQQMAYVTSQPEALQQQEAVVPTNEQAQAEMPQQQMAYVTSQPEALQQQQVVVPTNEQAQAERPQQRTACVTNKPEPLQQQRKKAQPQQQIDIIQIDDETSVEKQLNSLILEKQESKKKSMVSFGDIEGALPKFTGDDGYTVTKWLEEFEKVTNVVGCAQAEKYIFARRMVSGSAKLFLRSTKAEDWPSLKKELAAEFQRTVGVKDILRKLDSRKWKRGQESLHRYALEMQEIGEGAPITPAELVEFIVEGMQDKSMAALVFMNTTTVADFKMLIPKYEKMVAERAQRQVKSVTVEPARQEVRCYNCQGIGHYANVCKRPQRPMGACFKCGRTGHLKTNCPLQTVAAAAEDDELDWNAQPM